MGEFKFTCHTVVAADARADTQALAVDMLRKKVGAVLRILLRPRDNPSV
jgi:hypothetical protein